MRNSIILLALLISLFISCGRVDDEVIIDKSTLIQEVLTRSSQLETYLVDHSISYSQAEKIIINRFPDKVVKSIVVVTDSGEDVMYVANFENLRQPKNLVKFVPESDINKVSFENLDDYTIKRDELLFEILYQTGIRKAELIGLRDKDVDKLQRKIKVLGKRDKERFIPVSHELLQMVGHYQALRDERFASHADRLLLNDKGEEMTPYFVYNKVHRMLEGVTSLKQKSPHVLRHTFATHLLDEGASLAAIQKLLGHADLATTQVYAHNTIEQLKNIHRQAHPKGG